MAFQVTAVIADFDPTGGNVRPSPGNAIPAALFVCVLGPGGEGVAGLDESHFEFQSFGHHGLKIEFISAASATFPGLYFCSAQPAQWVRQVYTFAIHVQRIGFDGKAHHGQTLATWAVRTDSSPVPQGITERLDSISEDLARRATVVQEGLTSEAASLRDAFGTPFGALAEDVRRQRDEIRAKLAAADQKTNQLFSILNDVTRTTREMRDALNRHLN